MPVKVVKRGNKWATVEVATGETASTHDSELKAKKARNLRNALHAGSLRPSKRPRPGKRFVSTKK